MMMKTPALVAAVSFLVALAGVSPSSQAQERYDDSPLTKRFAIRIGGFLIQDFDTTIRLDSTQVPIGTIINLEDSLNVESDARVVRIDGSYRFNKKHRINFGWFASSRSGDAVVTEEIRIGDPDSEDEIVISPGARILSQWNFDVVNVIYNWSFLNTWRYELFLGAGLNIRDLKLDFAGDFDPGDGVVREEQVNAEGILPLPVVSFGGRWNFSKKWLAGWRWQWFAIQIGDYGGNLKDVVLSFENDTSKHVGFGFGLNSFALNITAEGEEFKGEVSEDYLGLLGYVKVYF